jgi:hypothetical protein
MTAIAVRVGRVCSISDFSEVVDWGTRAGNPALFFHGRFCFPLRETRLLGGSAIWELQS